jgi:hypothetical protein
MTVIFWGKGGRSGDPEFIIIKKRKFVPDRRFFPSPSRNCHPEYRFNGTRDLPGVIPALLINPMQKTQ